jgi:hypothetical protein
MLNRAPHLAGACATIRDRAFKLDILLRLGMKLDRVRRFGVNKLGQRKPWPRLSTVAIAGGHHIS